MPVISKIIKIKTPKLPPEIDFIEEQIKKEGIEPLRWAIINVNDYILTISASGRTLS
ncbi:hypothetical protein IJ670_06030 [bacterium]|nr:hypothetical protein [bacterium]